MSNVVLAEAWTPEMLDTKEDYEWMVGCVEKYNLYEQALEKAVTKLQKAVRLLLVGYGTGGLLQRCVNVLEKWPGSMIVAVEHNPVGIQLTHQKEWPNYVQLIDEDVSKLPSMPPFDFIVSDLLGSFGNNELCPEILYDPLLKPFVHDNTIFIPSSHSSYVTPVTCKSARDSLKSNSSVYHQPWVMGFDYRTREHYQSLAKATRIFTFEYNPKKIHHSTPPNLQLTANLTFSITVPPKKKVHVDGYLGYFEAELYDGIKLTSNPWSDDSKRLHEWSPYFFPIRTILLHHTYNQACMLSVALRLIRGNEGKRTWFEWQTKNVSDIQAQIQKYNEHGNNWCMKRKDINEQMEWDFNV